MKTWSGAWFSLAVHPACAYTKSLISNTGVVQYPGGVKSLKGWINTLGIKLTKGKINTLGATLPTGRMVNC